MKIIENHVATGYTKTTYHKLKNISVSVVKLQMNHQDVPAITRNYDGFLHFADGITISNAAIEECFHVKIRDYFAAHPNTQYVPSGIILQLCDESRDEIYWDAVDTVTKQKNEKLVQYMR
jgi:hypothetical protein